MTSPVPNAYFRIARADEDRLIREILESSATTFKIDDGDETYFRYSTENDLKMRTCHECQISEFQSADDGQWILYLTKERFLWACEQIQKQNYDLKCSLCEKFTNRWMEKRKNYI